MQPFHLSPRFTEQQHRCGTLGAPTRISLAARPHVSYFFRLPKTWRKNRSLSFCRQASSVVFGVLEGARHSRCSSRSAENQERIDGHMFHACFVRNQRTEIFSTRRKLVSSAKSPCIHVPLFKSPISLIMSLWKNAFGVSRQSQKTLKRAVWLAIV